MKVSLTILATLFLQTTFGQFKLGTYKIQPDTNDILSAFSELVFKRDNSFTYKFRTISCFLWYDSDGKWKTNNDTLTLVDTIISHHPVVNFTKNKETNDDKISILVKTKDNKPIQGIKILYIFINSEDTLSGLTNADGKFIINTKGIRPTRKEGKYRSVDDVEIWVVYTSKKRQDQTTNNFSDLSAEIECVIDEDAKNKSVIRTTFYKIEKTNLVYLSQQYNSENVRPGRYLYGNYKLNND